MGILELNDLTYSYDKKKKVLRGINAQMETGKMYAILGPSGCGKTSYTFYDVLCWIEIFINGEDINWYAKYFSHFNKDFITRLSCIRFILSNSYICRIFRKTKCDAKLFLCEMIFLSQVF